MLRDLSNVDGACLDVPTIDRLRAAPSAHPPRILLLYGSLRERSYSRFLTLEAERLLKHFGAETRIFDPHGLPLPDGADVNHPKVKELRELSLWSEGQVWTSPERHGAMSGVMKAQIDWIPLSVGAVRPTQGRTLAVMQVSGGSQSFNAVNQMRVLGRWMRMVTIPNQSSVAKAFQTIFVATDRPKLRDGKTYKDESGYTAKETEFHKVTCFNGLATAVANNRNKGDLVAVEGRLHYTRWQDADGNDRYGCEIIADRIDFY